MKTLSLYVFIGLLIACIDVDTAPAQITFGSLVDEIIDRDQLAVHPCESVAYKTLQVSSRNTNPTALGAPASFANPDRNYFSGEQAVGGERHYLMLEDTGPGVITRWWMTSRSNTGEIKVFVDGSSTPVMSGIFKDLLGDHPEMGDELSFKSKNATKSGQNFYAPIPYSQSIKIVFSEPVDTETPLDGGVYYNINYRKYESTETVQSYSTIDPTTYSTQLTQTNNAIATPRITGHVGNQHSQNATLAAGQNASYTLTGTGAIRRMQLKLTATDQAAALKDTYVELVFDGQVTARVPAGHFFGNGDGSSTTPYNTFEDLHRTVESDGTMTSRWVMPFENNAQVRLVNEGSQSVGVALEVDSGNWAWNEGSMHFHANYVKENGIKTRSGTGTADFRFLTVRGKGSYVGDTLSLRNGSTDWWGEGDEKVYLDYIDSNGVGHNAQPDHYGTGTEDYYGYAYGHTDLFESGFVSQPLGVGNNTADGHVVNSRVRALDAVPFNESLKFDMEILHNGGETNMDFASTAYWYGRPGASAMRTAADLAVDYQAGYNFSSGGIPDTAGDGRWVYMMSDAPNPSGTGVQTENLSYGEVGRLGSFGYGGGEHGTHNLPALSTDYLFATGAENIGIDGGPGYHELTMHPGGIVTSQSSSLYGEAEMPYVVMRWTAGESSCGLANISGSVRNLVDGNDSVDFYIYVDGELAYSAIPTSDILPESYFDFDVILTEGSYVDFVLGNGPADNIYNDESFLRATIMVLEYAVRVPGDTNNDGKVDETDLSILGTNWGTEVTPGNYHAGDFNGDGVVNAVDASILAANWGYDATAEDAAAVPEPAMLTGLMSLVGGLVLMACRRRRCPIRASCLPL